VWDTGTVTGPDAGASYAGPALSDGTRYWWTVRTLDARGRASQWAAPSQFGTALGATWDALPVWARQPAGGKSSGWAFLRGSIRIYRKPILAATVYATGRSTEPARQYVFRLSLNGTVLGVGPVRPPDPATGNEYSSWNVTSALRAGADTFGALAYSAARPSFQLELIVQYRDGTRQVWGTGPNWQGLDGGGAYPAAGSISPQYYAAPVEDLDAGRYPFGFDTSGYQPTVAGGWTPAITRTAITGLTPDPAANMVLAAHKPVKVTTLGPGRYLLDFGVTQVGGLRLTLNGTAGQRVRILSGEVLSGPDSVRYKLSAGDTYDDTWTLRAGKQTLQYWGYRAFRYVEVTGAPQPLTAANTAALALVYPGQPGLSAMSTSSAPLNGVWQFTKNTVEALNLSPYVDSPTRERSGAYAGDDAAAAARIKAAMQAKLYDPGTGAFRDGVGVAHEAIQSSVYAVALGAASPAEAKTAAAWIARRGMACSVYCAAYLLEALYDGGQPQAALSLMTADTTAGPHAWLGNGADPSPAGQPHAGVRPGSHAARRGQRRLHQRRRRVRRGGRRARDRDGGGGPARGPRGPGRLGRRGARDGAGHAGRRHRDGGQSRREPGRGAGRLRLAPRLYRLLTAACPPSSDNSKRRARFRRANRPPMSI
jgi:hypothetical protein